MPTTFFKMVLFIWLMFLPAALLAQEEQRPKAPAGDDINQVDVSQMTDIHDIKPLARLAWYQRQWFVILAIALAVVLLAGAITYWVKRRKVPTPAVEVVQPPDQIAQALLREMTDVRQFDGKSYYFRLTAIVREYLQGRFGINAPDLTTEELRPRIMQLSLNADLACGLVKLMQGCEPIKYADGTAFEHQMQQDWLFAQRFVSETAPEDPKSLEGHLTEQSKPK